MIPNPKDIHGDGHGFRDVSQGGPPAKGPSRLTWNEVRKGLEWHAGGLARFYKIIYRPATGSGDARDTSRTSFYSLYLCYPEGMDHYISSAAGIDCVKAKAQEHADK